MSTVTGSLRSIGLASMAPLAPRLILTINKAAVTGTTVIPSAPLSVVPDSDGVFSFDIAPTDAMSEDHWYTIRIEWLNGEDIPTGRDFPDWELRVPTSGGQLGPLLEFPSNPAQVFVGDFAPKNSTPGTWWLNSTSGDLYEITVGGEWVLKSNLRGPRGLTGKTGDRGLAGVNALENAAAMAAYLNDAGTNAFKTAMGASFFRVITPQMFGAVGNGVADDTAAVQAAVNVAIASNTSSTEKPPYTGNNGTVFFPLGTYSVNEIQVPGTIHFLGAGGGTIGNSTLLQRTSGQAIVRLKKYSDALIINSTKFENMSFKSESAAAGVDIAQIVADTNIFCYSVYIRNCWFKSPERYAIFLPQGDDIQISGCTFDVSGLNAIKFGVLFANNYVMNSSITDNTFYQIAVNHIEMLNARGITISGNRAYTHGTAMTSSVFLTTYGALSARSIAVTGNSLYRVNGLAELSTTTKTISFTGNVINEAGGYLLSLRGGGIIYGLVFTGNAAESAVGVPYSSAPFTGVGCGLQQSIIAHNSITAGATNTRLFDLPDARVTGNIINNNVSLRFTSNNNFAVPANNGA